MKKPFLLLVTLFVSALTAFAQTKSIKDFGAKGDGVSDDTQALINGIQGSSTLMIPAGTYNIRGVVNLISLNNKTIIADKNAIIRNTVDNKGSFNIRQCNDFSITGGTWTYVHLPTSNSKSGGEHYFSIVLSKNIQATHMHIIGSAETGFSIVDDYNVTIANNEIEHCYRDGIYSHYSSNLVYCGNYLHDIKDDAMSMHDYGIASQRTFIAGLGAQQAGNAIVFDNTTRNTVQGFSSIGCTKVFVANNDIQNTVTGGIAMFNSQRSFPGSLARVNKVVISNNKLSYVGGGTTVMNVLYPNSGQLNSGRAAIFVGALDDKDYILSPSTRLQYVTVNNNTVSNCQKNAVYFGQIDNLNFFANVFSNNNTSADNYAGKSVEIKDCKNVSIGGNTIKDERSNPAARDVAYSLNQVSGNMGKWNVQTRGAKEDEVISSSMQNINEMQKDVAIDLGSFTLDPTEFKIIKQPFTTGLLADYINLLAPRNLANKTAYNAFVDTDSNTLVIIIRNTSRQPLQVTGAGWQVREFYHN